LIIDAHPLEDGRIQKHIRFLQDQGYNVYHIHFIPYAADQWVDDGKYSLFGEKSWHINLHWKIRHKGLRLLNYLSLFSPALTRKTIDVIRSLDMPSNESGIIHVHDPILLPLAKIIQSEWLTHAKIVYDRHEIYEGMKRIGGISGYRLFEMLSKNSISGVVIVSERFKEKIAGMFPKSIIHTVPNYPVKSMTDKRKILDKIDSFSQSDPLNCVYIGSLRQDLDRDINLLLKTADNILAKFPHSKFFIGGPCYDNIILNDLKKLQQKYQKRFNYLGTVPNSQVIKITEEAHIGFLFLKNQPEDDFRTPNKIYEYLLCGLIPIIRGNIEDSEKIAMVSLLFSYRDPIAFLECQIESLLPNRKKMQEMMRYSYELGHQYEWETVALRYLDLYRSL